MADRVKVIKGLAIERECVSRDCNRDCARCDLAQDREWLLSVYDETLELLKEREARVLTTDELFYMEHQGVYIERRNSQLYATEPAIVLRTSVCEPSLGGNKYILMRENKLSDSRWACDYNKGRKSGWRCWTSKPTEEQRKAVKWA